MNNQESEEFYLNLSRRELQVLCKEHGLPANKTREHMAKSLASFFKIDSATLASLEGRSVAHVDVSSLEERSVVPVDEDAVGRCTKKARCPETEINEPALHEKVSDAIENAIRSPPISNGAKEDCECNVPESRNIDSSCMAISNPQVTASSPSGNKCDIHDKKGKSQNYTSPMKFDGIRHHSGHCVSQPVICRDKRVGESCKEGKPRPFEFYVESEKGINLCVDLSQTTWEWVKSMQDSVRIPQNAFCANSSGLLHEIKSLGESSKHMRTSCGHGNKGVQTEEVEGMIQPSCVASSSMLITEIDHSDVHLSEITEKSSKSSLLVSDRNPLQTAGSFVNEIHAGPMMVPFSIGSVALPPKCADVPFSTKSGAAVGSAVNNCVDCPSSNLFGDGLNNHDSLQSWTSKAVNFCPENADVNLQNVRCKFYGLGPPGNGIPVLSGEIHKKVNPPDAVSLQNSASTSNSTVMQISEVADPCDDVGPTNHTIGQLAHGAVLDSVPQEPSSTFHDEQVGCPSINERQSSELSQIQDPSDQTCKISHTSKYPEEFQSKRQDTEDSGTPKNLRSGKHLAGGSRTSSLPRRRSTRLVSKK
ncbi:hypothetical protein QJS04_geneDACA014175 [Acorus gramineus]|uniref:SAP domain-containing protein n=1 Tax=Acorus gramineus TaxID=55184 RepID=A0AAV9B0Q2_ACOGR|nr:hypothetical protein QJS04_geneDACA014175 [Acorus gramineus]